MLEIPGIQVDMIDSYAGKANIIRKVDHCSFKTESMRCLSLNKVWNMLQDSLREKVLKWRSAKGLV